MSTLGTLGTLGTRTLRTLGTVRTVRTLVLFGKLIALRLGQEETANEAGGVDERRHHCGRERDMVGNL